MNLRNFAEIIEADEVLLFERATFLVRTFCSTDVFQAVFLYSEDRILLLLGRTTPFYISIYIWSYKALLSASGCGKSPLVSNLLIISKI